MKLIIELSENDYKALKEDGVQNHLALADTVIANSMPYEETPKYFPPCEDCNTKMGEIRQAYDKMKAMERPHGDLISREALKEEFAKHTDSWGNLQVGWDYLIDNAPTVSFMISPDYVTELQNANKELIKQLEEVERPQGEWIISQTMDCHSDIVNVYTCPFCGKREYSAYPFCHCGAELKGGAK